MAQNTLLRVMVITQLIFLSCRALELASKSNMYGSVMGVRKWDILLDIASVNMANGNITTLVTSEAFYGSLGMADGISTFDSKNGVYYMVTNALPNPLLYTTDVVNAVALPSLDLYIYAFSCLAVRPATSEVFAVLMITQSTWSLWALSFPLGNVRKMNLPTAYSDFVVAAFDDNDTLIVLAAKTRTDVDILFINPNTGELENQIPLLNCSNVFITSLVYDSSDKMLYGGSASNTQTIHYDWVKVNPKTGDCSSNTVSSDKGIVTSWAYDPNARNVWYAEEINGGFLLRGVNVDTNSIVSEFTTTILLTTIEIDPTP